MQRDDDVSTQAAGDALKRMELTENEQLRTELLRLTTLWSARSFSETVTSSLLRSARQQIKSLREEEICMILLSCTHLSRVGRLEMQGEIGSFVDAAIAHTLPGQGKYNWVSYLGNLLKDFPLQGVLRDFVFKRSDESEPPPVKYIRELLNIASERTASILQDLTKEHKNAIVEGIRATEAQQRLFLPQEAQFISPTVYFAGVAQYQSAPEEPLKWLTSASYEPEDDDVNDGDSSSVPTSTSTSSPTQSFPLRLMWDEEKEHLTEKIRLPLMYGAKMTPITVSLPHSAASLVQKVSAAQIQSQLGVRGGLTEAMAEEARAAQATLLTTSIRKRLLPESKLPADKIHSTSQPVPLASNSPTSGNFKNTLDTQSTSVKIQQAPTKSASSVPKPNVIHAIAPLPTFNQPTLTITSDIFVPLTKQQIAEEQRQERERIRLEKKKREEEKKAEIKAEKDRAKLAEKEEKDRAKREKEAIKAKSNEEQQKKRAEMEARRLEKMHKSTSLDSKSEHDSANLLGSKRTANEIVKMEHKESESTKRLMRDQDLLYSSEATVKLELQDKSIHQAIKQERESDAAASSTTALLNPIFDDPAFANAAPEIKVFVSAFLCGEATRESIPFGAKEASEGVYTIEIGRWNDVDPADGRTVERRILFEVDFSSGQWKKRTLKKKKKEELPSGEVL